MNRIKAGFLAIVAVVAVSFGVVSVAGTAGATNGHESQCWKHEGGDLSNAHGKLTNGGKSVTLSVFSTSWAPWDHWESLTVKGGPNSLTYDHPSAGTAYFPPLNRGGQKPDVSHWIVCKGKNPPPPTTTQPSTTPPTEPPTTTAPPETTVPPTEPPTTTQPPETTEPPVTTVPPTEPPETTVPETEPPTTTEPEETTTVPVVETTTPTSTIPSSLVTAPPPTKPDIDPVDTSIGTPPLPTNPVVIPPPPLPQPPAAPTAPSVPVISELPNTGVNNVGLSIAAGLLLAAGIGAIYVARRRSMV